MHGEIKIEKVAFKGWQNSYRISNRLVALIVTGDIGENPSSTPNIGASIATCGSKNSQMMQSTDRCCRCCLLQDQLSKQNRCQDELTWKTSQIKWWDRYVYEGAHGGISFAFDALSLPTRRHYAASS